MKKFIFFSTVENDNLKAIYWTFLHLGQSRNLKKLQFGL